ncbi:MAC/perforin domain-containing protein [Chlamydia sp. 17-3921]|uniref:MAC/perforin domain-containing protein n=1 Tax=Chlamydia sp. 17-3921 TaxID=2675798 RepID=UPI001F2FDD29|nr:MAC/perforin domain-containing protein [Chlamydia sp. 17-3921]
MNYLSAFNFFDERLSNINANQLSWTPPYEEENSLETFINGLTESSFPKEVTSATSPSGKENITSNNYFLTCSLIDKSGAYYEIIDATLLQPIAACIVSHSILEKPFDSDTVSDIQNAFIRSMQNGVRYLLSSNGDDEVLGADTGHLELIKNVSFLGQALDITKLDPANIVNTLSSYRVIDHSFTEDTAIPSSDGRLGIPPGTKLLPKQSADIAISTSVFDEKTTFSSKFSTTLTINIPPPLPKPCPENLLKGEAEATGENSKEICVQRMQLFPSYDSKLLDIVKVAKRKAKILINKMTYSNIWRNQAKSQILTEENVRLDLQGFISGKFNYQIQVGTHTIATVLIDRAISEIRIPSEQAYAIRKIKSGFQQSLDDCHIYYVGFKSSTLIQSSGFMMEDEDPMSGALGEAASKASAFSGSFTFDFVQKNTSASKNVVTHSTAKHTLYTLKQDIAYDPKKLKLDDEFCFWVKKLVDKPSVIQDFIKEVGTHYTTSVTYGGVGFQVLKISTEEIEKLQEKKLTVEAAASEALLKSKTSSDTQQGYSSYSESMSSQTVFLGGTVLPEMGKEQLDFKAWSESVPQEPVPLEIAISPITELLVSQYFPSIDAKALAKTRSDLGKAILEYLKAKTPHQDKPSDKLFTTGYDCSASQFVLYAANSPLVVSDPYVGTWSALPYLFPTIKETSGAHPLIFFFSLDNIKTRQNVVHNTTYFLRCLAARFGNYGEGFIDYDSLSFYSYWGEGYFDTSAYTDRCTWVIEKLNTTEDLYIREGDQVRFKHVATGEYLATVPMRDGKQTLTKTSVAQDGIFIIKRPLVG